ncbi:hypothetical protein FBU59_000481 [Linderina macrospora]|uniref:Uncharacterized protein n=1 Tax=Linderina macrospora TaxID=4868 RepID=A0ACC1JGR4_9FUNG|nr:hypothetical protein FBU59_000481 [Linderina macrospora]
MKYGIPVNFHESDVTGNVTGGRPKSTVSGRTRPTAIPRTEFTHTHFTALTPIPAERKRRLDASTPRPTWQLFSPRTAGTGFPTNTHSTTKTLGLETRVPRMKLRRVEASVVTGAQKQAVDKYASGIRKEVDETMEELARLAVSGPKAPYGMEQSRDPGVSGMLEQIHRMRDELEQKFIDEDEEKLRVIREAEEKIRRAAEEKVRKERERVEAIERAEQARLEAIALAKKEKMEAELKLAQEAWDRKMKKEEEEEKERERVRKQEEEQRKQQQAASGLLVSPQALEWAAKYRDLYRVLMDETAVQMASDPKVKAWCFKQKGLIIRSVGQLVSTMEGVRRVSQHIMQIIAEAERYGEAVHLWVLNLAAKAIVKQAEAEVSAKLSAAYPLAAMAVEVMERYPMLAELIFVRLVKKCPYVVPQYMARKPGQSVNEYLKSMGYKEHDDDELEASAAYESRMVGMVALFAAIVQTTTPASGNPMSVHYGWTWMARMMNLAPRVISPGLVMTFVEIAGTTMMAAYGKQFKKLLRILATHWVPKIPTDDPLAIASKSRLVSYLEEYQQKGRLGEIEGRIIAP